MDFLKSYNAGVNLGGWISQFQKYDHEHFKKFIKEDDIKRIASWGMDHVRLPVDYIVLEDDGNPFNYSEDGFQYIDDCLGWCKNYGLNMILDLHRTPGFSFGTLAENSLFDDINMQKRFLGIWTAIAKRYVNQPHNLIFELLNEIVEPTSYRWNALAKKAVQVIREVDSDRGIIIGGNFYNSVHTLKELNLFDDPNVFHTFHFYEPIMFTHQRAQWMAVTAAYKKEITYPGDFTDFEEFLKLNPQYAESEWSKDFGGDPNDKNLMLKLLNDATDFIKYAQKPLYCGEFGVIESTPLQSRINWNRDFIDIMNEYGIGRAYWTYKGMSFGLLDREGKIVSQEMIDILSKKIY